MERNRSLESAYYSIHRLVKYEKVSDNIILLFQDFNEGISNSSYNVSGSYSSLYTTPSQPNYTPEGEIGGKINEETAEDLNDSISSVISTGSTGSATTNDNGDGDRNENDKITFSDNLKVNLPPCSSDLGNPAISPEFLPSISLPSSAPTSLDLTEALPPFLSDSHHQHHRRQGSGESVSNGNHANTSLSVVQLAQLPESQHESRHESNRSSESSEHSISVASYSLPFSRPRSRQHSVSSVSGAAGSGMPLSSYSLAQQYEMSRFSSGATTPQPMSGSITPTFRDTHGTHGSFRQPQLKRFWMGNKNTSSLDKSGSTDMYWEDLASQPADIYLEEFFQHLFQKNAVLAPGSVKGGSVNSSNRASAVSSGRASPSTASALNTSGTSDDSSIYNQSLSEQLNLNSLVISPRSVSSPQSPNNHPRKGPSLNTGLRGSISESAGNSRRSSNSSNRVSPNMLSLRSPTGSLGRSFQLEPASPNPSNGGVLFKSLGGGIATTATTGGAATGTMVTTEGPGSGSGSGSVNVMDTIQGGGIGLDGQGAGPPSLGQLGQREGIVTNSPSFHSSPPAPLSLHPRSGHGIPNLYTYTYILIF